MHNIHTYVLPLPRLMEEKKEVESEIQRQPKPEVNTTRGCSFTTLSNTCDIMEQCSPLPSVVCPVVVLVGCRAEDERAD